MATTYITWSDGAIVQKNRQGTMPGLKELSSEKVTTSGTSASTGEAPAETLMVKVTPNGANICFRVGASPQTAVDGDNFISDGVPTLIEITIGHVIAIIEV